MIALIQDLKGALIQVLVVLLVCFLIWLIVSFKKRDKLSDCSFSNFSGLHISGFLWDIKFSGILCLTLLLAVVSIILQYCFVPDFINFSKNQTSPYWMILKKGFDFKSIISALIYCVLKAGLSEELLFRGLIAKRSIKNFGVFWGNFCQAFLFWLLHFLLIGMVTKQWVSLMQVILLSTIFPIALIMGYANEKLYKGSILPSWILHSSMNFVTFLILAYLLI